MKLFHVAIVALALSAGSLGACAPAPEYGAGVPHRGHPICNHQPGDYMGDDGQCHHARRASPVNLVAVAPSPGEIGMPPLARYEDRQPINNDNAVFAALVADCKAHGGTVVGDPRVHAHCHADAHWAVTPKHP